MTLPESPITRLAEHAVFANRFITVYDDDVRFSDGRTGTYIRIVQSDGKPGVVVLPISGDKVGMVHVYRYPVGAWEWGCPRGLAHGGDPEVTARQELLEELGSEPSQLIELGRMTPDSGTLTAVVHVFAAEYPAATSLIPQDTDEVSSAQWWPKHVLTGGIVTGQIRDGFTLAAACYAMCWRLLPPFVQAPDAYAQ